MIKREEPKQGEFYKHFKDKLYQIISIAIHSETREKLVIYQALYGDYKTYARPLDMFLSEVDKDKYPEVTATYRFEKVEITKLDDGIVDISSKEDGVKKAIIQENIPFTFNLEKESKKESKKESEKESEKEEVNPILVEFLDSKSYEKKLEIVHNNKSKITNDLINAMSASIDCTVEEGELEGRINSFLFCLNTLNRFESKRFR